jgi:transcriptional regulator with XRE-family HTH domain
MSEIDTSYTKEIAGETRTVIDGTAIKKRRLELKLTLRALGDKAKLSPVFIWEVEEGFKNMKPETFDRLRAALK